MILAGSREHGAGSKIADSRLPALPCFMYDTVIGRGMSGLAAGIGCVLRSAGLYPRAAFDDGGLNSFYRLRGMTTTSASAHELHAQRYQDRPPARLLRQLRLRWDDLPSRRSSAEIAFPVAAIRQRIGNAAQRVARAFPNQADNFDHSRVKSSSTMI